MAAVYDQVIIGGGHNGLICGAYLSRAGVDTLLLESRTDVGGCTSTVSDLGARFNICHCDHTLIRAMPIADELALSDHGLQYVEPQAAAIFAFHDGGEPWVVFPDPDSPTSATVSPRSIVRSTPRTASMIWSSTRKETARF